jgi:uncharacterized membrane protein
MNGAQLHLVLNHVPVFAVLFGALLLAWALLRHSRELLRVALALMVGAAVAAAPAYLSGEPAEEQIEHAAGVSKQDVERHEDAAKVSLILIGITGVAALTVLVVQRRRPEPGWIPAAVLALALVAALQVAWTAHLGGGIRHPELSGNTTAATPEAGEDLEHD